MMIPISFDEWQKWSQTYTMLPYILKYDLGEHNRVLSWEKAWEQATGIEGTFVLESGKNARYSYLGLDPVASIEGDNQQARVTCRDGAVETWDETPLRAVKRWMKPYRSPRVEGLPKFIGGCAGFWSYDVVRTIEKLPNTAKDDLPLPAYRFLMIDQLWIIDHQEQMLICAYHTHIEGQPSIEQLRALYDTAKATTDQMSSQIKTSPGALPGTTCASRLTAASPSHIIESANSPTRDASTKCSTASTVTLKRPGPACSTAILRAWPLTSISTSSPDRLGARRRSHRLPLPSPAGRPLAPTAAEARSHASIATAIVTSSSDAGSSSVKLRPPRSAQQPIEVRRVVTALRWYSGCRISHRKNGIVVLMPSTWYSSQRARHPRDRLGAILGPGDELRDHRVVEDRHRVARHVTPPSSRTPGPTAGAEARTRPGDGMNPCRDPRRRCGTRSRGRAA